MNRRITAVLLGTVLALSGLAYAVADEHPSEPAVEAPEPTPEPTSEPTPEPTPDPAEEPPAEGSEEPSADEPTADITSTDAVIHGVERSQEGCGEGTYRNHGQYVSSTTERPRNEAAKSPCGKPLHDDTDDEAGDDDTLGSSEQAPKVKKEKRR